MAARWEQLKVLRFVNGSKDFWAVFQHVILTHNVHEILRPCQAQSHILKDARQMLGAEFLINGHPSVGNG